MFLPIFFCYLSCSNRNDIDSIVAKQWEQCNKNLNCVVDFSNVMGFEWDTMCFYSVGNSLDDIEKDLGFVYEQWTDIGDRVIFLHKGKIVYQKDWFPTVDKPVEGIVFLTDLKKFRITKSNAKFKIKKEGYAYYLEKLG